MNIKVCGITEFKQMQQLDALNVDFVGMIFHPASPRFVGDKLSKKDIKKADFDFKKVGVFVNPEMIDVLDAIDDYGLDVVQLHGHESAEMCEDLSSEVEVIKAFSIDSNVKDIDALVAPYDAVCDYYLFDTAGNAAGGNGEKFDWSILTKAKIEKPFLQALRRGIGRSCCAYANKLCSWHCNRFLTIQIVGCEIGMEAGQEDNGFYIPCHG